eukprot:3301800-Prymnesium_polylepis.1
MALAPRAVSAIGAISAISAISQCNQAISEIAPRAAARGGRRARVRRERLGRTIEHHVELTGPVLPRRAAPPLDPLALVGDGRRDDDHAAVGVRLLVHHLVVVAAPSETVGDGDAAAVVGGSAEALGRVGNECLPLVLERAAVLVEEGEALHLEQSGNQAPAIRKSARIIEEREALHLVGVDAVGRLDGVEHLEQSGAIRGNQGQSGVLAP